MRLERFTPPTQLASRSARGSGKNTLSSARRHGLDVDGVALGEGVDHLLHQHFRAPRRRQ